MPIMDNTDNRFVNLEKKIGVFVLTAIFGVVLLLAFIALERDLFAAKVKLYTIADSGKDLIPGMPVRLSGLKIGKVGKLNLDDITRLKVELLINEDYVKWIKTDSKIILFKEGLIGEAVLEITPGSKSASNIKDNDSIPFERAVELGEIADDMRLEVKQLMADLRSLIGEISDPKGDVKSTFLNFNRLSSEMLVTFKAIDKSIERVDVILAQTEAALGKISKAAKDVDADIPKILGNISKTVEGVDAETPKILDQIDRSLANLEQFTGNLNIMLKKVAPEIPATVAKGGRVMEEAEDVLGALKRLWPINKGMEEEKHEIQSVDSYE